MTTESLTDELANYISALRIDSEKLDIDEDSILDYLQETRTAKTSIESLLAQLDRVDELVTLLQDEEDPDLRKEDLLEELEAEVSAIDMDSVYVNEEILHLQKQGIHSGFLDVNEIEIDHIGIAGVCGEILQTAKENLENESG